MAIRLAPNRFFGEVLLCRPVGGAHLSISRIEPSRAVPWHVHRSPYLSLVLEGGYRETYGRASSDYRKGDLVYRPAEFEHCDRVGEAGTLCVNLELSDGLDWPADARVRFAPHVAGLAYRSLGRLAAGEAGLRDELLVGAMLSALLEPRPELSGVPRWLRAAIDAIEADPAHDWSLRSLASASQVHPVHFCRSFRSATGMTLSLFVRERRLGLSRRLLTETDRAAGAIALELGFADAAHFSRRFRTAFGQSPSEFRATKIAARG